MALMRAHGVGRRRAGGGGSDGGRPRWVPSVNGLTHTSRRNRTGPCESIVAFEITHATLAVAHSYFIFLFFVPAGFIFNLSISWILFLKKELDTLTPTFTDHHHGSSFDFRHAVG
jgi:hypothetical protein